MQKIQKAAKMVSN